MNSTSTILDPLLPGAFCPKCLLFTGFAKGPRTECRGCGAELPEWSQVGLRRAFASVAADNAQLTEQLTVVQGRCTELLGRARASERHVAEMLGGAELGRSTAAAYDRGYFAGAAKTREAITAARAGEAVATLERDELRRELEAARRELARLREAKGDA